MKDKWNVIQAGLGAVGGFLGWAFGGLDGFLYTLIVFVAIDYITGVICAIVDKKLSSDAGYRGILQKIMIFVVVAVGNIIDVLLLNEQGSPLRTMIIFFYLSNEGLSILEHAARLNIPIPAQLKSVILQLREKEEETDAESDDVIESSSEEAEQYTEEEQSGEDESDV